MIRPYGFAPLIADDAGRNEPPPLIFVLLEPARSADPPQNSGNFAAIALITSPDAARVATSYLEQIPGYLNPSQQAMTYFVIFPAEQPFHC